MPPPCAGFITTASEAPAKQQQDVDMQRLVHMWELTACREQRTCGLEHMQRSTHGKTLADASIGAHAAFEHM
jgi:hypothetical protein